MQKAQTGVWVIIGAITMSFAALTSALVVRQGAATDWQGFALPRVLYASTLILLLSSLTMEFSRKRLLAGLKSDSESSEAYSVAKSWLFITLGLGLLFVAGQILAVRSLAAQGIYLSTNPSSSFFYVFTVLHGLHVFGGIFGLLYAVRSMKPTSMKAGSVTLTAASTYWHFLAVLWVYLLIVLAVRM
jgi:cytochrome c oxidase subunit 3